MKWDLANSVANYYILFAKANPLQKFQNVTKLVTLNAKSHFKYFIFIFQATVVIVVLIFPKQHLVPYKWLKMAVFLSYWHHFIFLLLVSCLEVISSLVVSSTEDCIPRCCAQGQILDHTGTRCLRDLSREYIPDPCGRRDSFLPTCESQDGSEEGYVTHLYTLLEPDGL